MQEGLAGPGGTRMRLWPVPVALCGLCLAAVAILPDSVLKVGFVAASAAFLVLGAALLAGAWTPRVVADLIRAEPQPCFFCDAEMRVCIANAAALRQFQARPGLRLADLLGADLAEPDTLLRSLQSEALALGRVGRDVLIGDGALHLEARRAGPNRILWRIERLEAGTGPCAGGPRLTLGRSGAILAMNDAARALVGKRMRHVEELFGPAAVEDGDVREIAGPEGPQRVELRLSQAGPGRRELVLRPPPDPVRPGDAAFDALPIALLRLDAEGGVIAANPEARRLLDIDAAAAGRLADLMEGLGRPIADWLADAVAGRGLGRPEFLRLRRAGSEAYVQVALSRSGDGPDGAALIAAISDATELKTLEAQFVQSQKMQAIGQLAGGIAHDFNNLLTAISGHCDLLLLRHNRGDGDYADLIQIAQNANRAASLVGQLLAFSRKQTLRTEPLDLRETLSDLTHLLNRLVGEKVALELRHDPALPAIRGDRRQLEQVMMNLVVNARDAMPEGGRILIETGQMTLETALRRDRAVVEPGHYVTVRVSDTGCGIPPDKVAKVFEPFYTTKRTGDGTGLGLSTVYGIVKQTGGFVFLDSTPGEGTCFQLMFPARPDAAEAAEAPPEEARGASGLSGEGGVALLVEDEAPVRAFAARALQLRGFTVLEAESGEAALEMLADPLVQVDVFVSDVVMPGQDGPSWVRAARAARPDVPVVFMSGYAEDALEGAAGEIGDAVFLQKPFSLNELADTVRARIA
ncbi:hybrid sensor histidine kinase/response regulator [Roseivivax sp. CAU 1761]